MHLSRHTDYTLRVLLYLAVRPDERGTLADIARFFDISHDHLRKVVHELAKLGYVRTFRGKGGGIELARKATEINIGEILEKLEGGHPLIDCKSLNCRLAPACTLNIALRKAQRSFFDELHKYSLADLIGNRAMLNVLVG